MIHPFDLEALEDRLQRHLAAEAATTEAAHREHQRPVGGPPESTSTVNRDGAGAQGDGGGALP